MDILSLDYGDARIGWASASESLKMAFAKGYILNDQKRDDTLKQLIAENRPKKIVLGLPLKKDLGFTPATDKALEFAWQLSGFAQRDLFLVDERFTTAFSQISLREGGKSTRKSKKIIDAESAKAIAETFLKNPAWVFRFTDIQLTVEKIFDYMTRTDDCFYFSGAFDIVEQTRRFKKEMSIFELNPWCYSRNRRQAFPENVISYRFAFSSPDDVELCS